MKTAEQLQALLAAALDWVESPSLERCFDCLSKERDFGGLIRHTPSCRRGRFMGKIWAAVQEEILYEVQPENPMGMNILAWEALEKRAEKAEAGFLLLRDYLLEVRARVSGIEACCIDILLSQAENPEQPVVVGKEVQDALK